MAKDPLIYPLDETPKDRTYAGFSDMLRSGVRVDQDILFFLNRIHKSTAGVAEDGVVDFGDPDELKTEAESTPSLKVIIRSGQCFVSEILGTLRSDFTTAAMVPPTATNDRIDLICFDVGTRSIKIIQGVEAGSPSAPATPTDHLVLAEIFHRDTETVIKDTDDFTNGFITDKRVP